MKHTSVDTRTLVPVFAALIVTLAARSAAADTITLAWNPNTESTVVGYMLHVGTQSGNYTQHIDVGLSTSYGWSGAAPGQRYCFVVSAYEAGPVEGPNSAEVCGYSNAYPVLVNPGSRSSITGQATSLQLQGSDPDGQAVSYSASGLPPGLNVMASTGYISGTPTTAGSYTVTATVSDGVLRSSQTFGWTISSTASGGGSDTVPPAVTITGPTSASTYTTTSSTVTLSGTASDNVGVAQIAWGSDRGGSGTASGTSNWSASVALASGTNTIIVTARDGAGNDASAVITVTSSSATGSTSGGGGLLGEYYSDLNLTTLITTRVDPVVDFGWNYGSPAANVPSDNFSARWTGQIVAPVTGTYSFSTMSDDGVRLWIGNQLLVDNWTDHGPTVDTAPAVTLQGGQSYAVRLEYYERSWYSIVQLLWSYPGQSTQVVPQRSLLSASSAAGLRADYYSGAGFSSLVTTRTDPAINFSWGWGSPAANISADNFSVRWSGAIVAPVSGTYTFSTMSDDGVRFSISDQLVIDNWSDHGPTTNTSAGIWLEAGQRYTVGLDYYERAGWSVIQLQWTVPGQAMQVIPASAFVP